MPSCGDTDQTVAAQGLSRRSVLGVAAAGAAGLGIGISAGPAQAQPISLPDPRPDARKVPASFLWGVSTAGHQIEGNNVNSDAWLMENVKPTIFPERSGDACDSLNRFQQDIDLVKALGFNTYRFSIEWSRIEPSEGQFSLAMLDYYKRVIACCHKAGIRPAVTFNHYTTPVWFAASGGMMRSDGPDIFARYCRKAAEHLADGMHCAFTLNEPQAPAIIDTLSRGGSRKNIAAMAAAAAKASGSDRFVSWKTIDPEAGVVAMISAHKLAFSAIKSVRGDLPTGVCLASIDYRGVGPNNIANAVRDRIDGPWLAAVKEAGDFVGVQNYWPLYFDDKGLAVAPKGSEYNGFFVLDYQSLANCARQAHAATGKPVLITENGIDTNDDAKRIRYTLGTLRELGLAVAEGLPLVGYLHWSLLDNYEWGTYKSRFGLVAVDPATFRRTPKESAHILGAFAKRGRL
jgi:beta-glucosidase